MLVYGKYCKDALTPSESASAKKAFRPAVTGSHLVVGSPFMPSPIDPERSSMNTRFTRLSSALAFDLAHAGSTPPPSGEPFAPPSRTGSARLHAARHRSAPHSAHAGERKPARLIG